MLKLGAEGKVIRQMGFLLAVLMGVLPMSAVADYSSHPSAAALADRVSARGVDRAWVDAALAEATKQESILKAIARPAEKSKPWSAYQDIDEGLFVEQGKVARQPACKDLLAHGSRAVFVVCTKRETMSR